MAGKDTYSLANERVEIKVREAGAELCQIRSVATGREYLWDGNPDVWASYAPVLFPIIGELKEGTYYYNENRYQLPRHGIVRQNPHVKLQNQTENSLSFLLEYDEDSLLVYPFCFRLWLTFTLNDTRIDVVHRVENLDESTMYFSVGGHPAFCIPRHAHESYEDYFLEFEQAETVSRWLLTNKGLLSGETEPVLNQSAILPLYHELFKDDALVFKDLKSRKVSLKSRKSPEVVTVRYDDFPYLGIWAKPAGNYVCIEPWLGVADSQFADQQLVHKEGMLSLGAGDVFQARFSIEITE